MHHERNCTFQVMKPYSMILLLLALRLLFLKYLCGLGVVRDEKAELEKNDHVSPTTTLLTLLRYFIDFCWKCFAYNSLRSSNL